VKYGIKIRRHGRCRDDKRDKDKGLGNVRP